MVNIRLSSFSFLKMSKCIIALTDDRLQNTNSLLTFHFIFSRLTKKLRILSMDEIIGTKFSWCIGTRSTLRVVARFHTLKGFQCALIKAYLLSLDQ